MVRCFVTVSDTQTPITVHSRSVLVCFPLDFALVSVSTAVCLTSSSSSPSFSSSPSLFLFLLCLLLHLLLPLRLHIYLFFFISTSFFFFFFLIFLRFSSFLLLFLLLPLLLLLLLLLPHPPIYNTGDHHIDEIIASHLTGHHILSSGFKYYWYHAGLMSGIRCQGFCSDNCHCSFAERRHIRYFVIHSPFMVAFACMRVSTMVWWVSSWCFRLPDKVCTASFGDITSCSVGYQVPKFLQWQQSLSLCTEETQVLVMWVEYFVFHTPFMVAFVSVRIFTRVQWISSRHLGLPDIGSTAPFKSSFSYFS